MTGEAFERFRGGGTVSIGGEFFGPDGTQTGDCGICGKAIARASVAQLNSVLVHTSCYGFAMNVLRALTICWRPDGETERMRT